MLIADFEWFEVVDVEMTNIIISSHFIFLLQYLTCLYIWNDFVEGQEMGHVHPLGRVWVHASSAWLSLGKLWKEEGIVIKYLLFIICYFCSCWINWIGLENWIWTAVSPLYYTGLDWTGLGEYLEEYLEDLEEGNGRKPWEEQIHNQPRTQSGQFWDPLLILDGGSDGKLCNPSYFAFSCKISIGLDWLIMNSHLRCSEWSFPT